MEVAIMSDIKYSSNKKKGQSMVEFALVLPILLLFFIGIMQIGFIINDYIALNRAVAEACRFGSTLVGYSSAEVLIVGKLIDSLGENIKKPNLRIVALNNQKFGPYSKNSTGDIIDGLGQSVTAFAAPLFFKYDNESQNNFSDDSLVSSTRFNCSYVSVRVEYDHEVVIPFADLISSATILLTVSSTWPVSAYYPNLMPAGQFRLSGALPIAVNQNACVLTGNPVTIKGDWLLAGGFGWLDLSVAYNSGDNPNAGPNELAAWISDPYSTPIQILPPQNIYSMTGQKNASSVRDALASLLGKNVMIPIYDISGSQGNNGYYHIVGFAVFKLNSIQNYPDLTATYVKTIMKIN